MKTTALFSNLPIEYLDEIRSGLNIAGIKTKIRYRGPRNTIADQKRSRVNRRAGCLKENAVTFTVYPQ